MDASTTIQMIASILLRVALKAAGGFLLAHGLIEQSASEKFLSVGMILGGALWTAGREWGHILLAAELGKLQAKVALSKAPLTGAAIQEAMARKQ